MFFFVDRKAQVLKALNRSTEAYDILQRLQVHCEKVRCTEATIRYRRVVRSHGLHYSSVEDSAFFRFFASLRVMLAMAELHWESSGFSTALPLLLQALALARQHHLQSLVSETVLHLAFTQVGSS